ncbi:MAG TPA: hypothetical protein VLI41_06465 [Phenylobacterium sp.]|uniref:hypothetical protein n=1 Tax=Phenylobacterium sp. TaxID=1871053 RepID=UPI002CB221F0|nr:hypothetical protein [Phenylobacterium sp.]HSV02833.1 hypothetical protein [Phenylobacterium sp.]
MTDQTPTPQTSSGPDRGANPALIKGDIDSGETGDKVPGFDPGAAPLGSDEEAAGPMVSGRTEARERVQERAARPQERRPNAATPELAPDGAAPRQGGGLAIAALIGVAAGIGLALVYLAI